MAVRGEFTNDAGDNFEYEVVQYKMRGPRVYKARSASYAKLDTSDIDWVRIHVTRNGGDGSDGLFTTMWGPYLNQSTIESELAVLMDDDGYLEAIG